MSLFAAYFAQQFDAKPQTHRLLTWKTIAEPYCNMVDHPEILMAAVEYMVESSRPYRFPGQWGAHGVTELLNDRSGSNEHKAGWRANGTWKELIAKCQKTITTGMLTHHHGAQIWRDDQNIHPDAKIRIQGPIGNDNKACEAAWNRLVALDGKHIIPLNPCHRRATKLRFKGIEMYPPYPIPEQADGKTKPKWKKHRDWRIDCDITLDGSSWGLRSLCNYRSWETPKWYKFPKGADKFKWERQKSETLTQWFNRTADFLESLLAKETSKRLAS